MNFWLEITDFAIFLIIVSNTNLNQSLFPPEFYQICIAYFLIKETVFFTDIENKLMVTKGESRGRGEG